MEISAKEGKNGKIQVYADGEYRFTVHRLIWYGCGLHEGDDVDEETLAGLHETAEQNAAYEKALRLLSMRAHSEKELERKLRERYGKASTAYALERCRQAGLVNDALFAESYAREIYERKFYAPRRIEQELLTRGVPKKIAQNAIETLEIDNDSAIINLINKMHLPPTLTKKEADRLMRRLLGAGYTPSEIGQVVRFSDEDYE